MVRLVQAVSLGVPRRIIIVADRLLLHGYVEGKHRLGEADAPVVVRELRQELLSGAEAEEVAGQPAVDAPVAAGYRKWLDQRMKIIVQSSEPRA